MEYQTIVNSNINRNVRAAIHKPWTVNTNKETTALLAKPNEIVTFPNSLTENMTSLHIFKVKISWNTKISRPWFYCEV